MSRAHLIVALIMCLLPASVVAQAWPDLSTGGPKLGGCNPVSAGGLRSPGSPSPSIPDPVARVGVETGGSNSSEVAGVQNSGEAHGEMEDGEKIEGGVGGGEDASGKKLKSTEHLKVDN